MIIYPAIDLRGGRVVRLREGDPECQTVFSDNPVEMARHWIGEGASWLHVVNLDGAFAAANDNESILKQIAALSLPVQFGGGLRSLADVERALAAGASRVVLGTAAVSNPDLVTDAIARYGSGAICVGLDARDGKVTTHGWTAISDMTPAELGRAMAARGVVHALYTNVNRDGGLSGGDITGTIALAQETGLRVIASGGVSSLEDIRALARSGVVAGAIIGMALYAGKLTLADALLEAVDEGTSC